MFKDLRRSKALYESIGAARAHTQGACHFTVLTEIVRRRDGCITKTIGDAVMAVFSIW
jgi:class 3 adenylate cyclase